MLFRIFQPEHFIVILAVALFVFGPSKLPQLGKTLGKAISELRSGMAGSDGSETSTGKDASPKTSVEHMQASANVEADKAGPVHN